MAIPAIGATNIVELRRAILAEKLRVRQLVGLVISVKSLELKTILLNPGCVLKLIEAESQELEPI